MPILNFMIKLKRFSYSIFSLVKRDILQRYAGSLLGFIWIFLNPLIQLLIYSYVFAIVLRVRIGPQFVGVNYTSWLLAGLLPWLFWADGISRSPMAIVDQKQLVKKTAFPNELFIIVQVLSSFFQHIIALLLFFVYLFFVHPIGLSMSWLLLFPIGLQILMMVGLGWFFSSINVYVRDVQQVVLVILNLLFYLTPIIYPPNAIPIKYQYLMEINPIYFIVESYRSIILTGKMNYSGEYFAIIFSIGFLLIGTFVFKRLKRGFADVL